MGYNYLDYLSENYNRYNYALVSISIFVVLSIVMGAIAFNNYFSDKSDYVKHSSKIKKIEVTTVEESSSVPYNFGKETKKALKIQFKSKAFYIVEMYEDKWEEIVSEIKPGTVVDILYTDSKMKNGIVELTANDKSYITFENIQKNSLYAFYVILLIFIISCSLLLALVIKRRKINKNRKFI